MGAAHSCQKVSDSVWQVSLISAINPLKSHTLAGAGGQTGASAGTVAVQPRSAAANDCHWAHVQPTVFSLDTKNWFGNTCDVIFLLYENLRKNMRSTTGLEPLFLGQTLRSGLKSIGWSWKMLEGDMCPVRSEPAKNLGWLTPIFTWNSMK